MEVGHSILPLKWETFSNSPSVWNILGSRSRLNENQPLLGWFSSQNTTFCFLFGIQSDKFRIKMQDSVMTYSFSWGVFVVPTQEHLKDKTPADINQTTKFTGWRSYRRSYVKVLHNAMIHLLLPAKKAEGHLAFHKTVFQRTVEAFH